MLMTIINLNLVEVHCRNNKRNENQIDNFILKENFQMKS